MKPIKISIILLLIMFLANSAYAAIYAQDTLFLYENEYRIKDGSVVLNVGPDPVCPDGTCIIGQQYSEDIIFYKTQNKSVLKYGEWIDYQHLNTPGCEGFVTLKEEISNTLKEFQNSNDYLETKQKVNQASSKDERAKLWDELEPKRNEFYKAKGLDFVYSPDCTVGGTTIGGSTEYKEEYIKNLQNNSVYEVNIKLPKSEDSDNPNRIGTDRCFKVDLKSGNFEQTSCLKNISEKKINGTIFYLIVIVGLILLIILLIIIFKILRKNKNTSQ